MAAATTSNSTGRARGLGGDLLPGLKPGTRRLPTGGLEPIPSQRAAVMLAFQRRAEGANLVSVSDDIAAKGLRVSPPHLAKVLADPLYATGSWSLRGPSGVVVGRMLAGPIVSLHTFVRAQRPWLMRLDAAGRPTRPPVAGLPAVSPVLLLRLSVAAPAWLAYRPRALEAVASLADVLRIPPTEVVGCL